MSEQSTGSAPRLLRGRVTPPELPARYVVRPRLVTRLEALIEAHAVLVVCATAGAGKSVALSDLAQRAQRPTAWLTCDRSDESPGRLLTYMQAAIAGALGEPVRAGTDALAAGLSAAESAGLLAEAVAARDLLLVVDEAERLGPAAGTWDVIRGFVRFAGDRSRVVLISRREPPDLDLPLGSVRMVGDLELAFTVQEAREALAAHGGADDAREAVEATGGWVTGVLFEAWRLEAHVTGTGGEADPLAGYLSAHILAGLPPAAQELLVRTAPLLEITAARAEAFGVQDAAAALSELVAYRLPGSWSQKGTTLRLHARFREFLQDLLARRGRAAVAAARRFHGCLLIEEGQAEEAVGELLAADAPELALAPAAAIVEHVIDRGDLALARGWLRRLGPVTDTDPTALATAELMLAIAANDLAQATQVADRLQAGGQRDALLVRSSRAMALIAWAYLHAARAEDVRAVLAAAPDGPEARAIRYATKVVFDNDDGPLHATPPELCGGLTDAFVLIGHYSLGRVGRLAAVPVDGWADLVARPWLLGALRAVGRTQVALELYERAHGTSGAPILESFVGAELLMDAGQPERARDAVRSGREHAERSGSLGLLGLNGLAALRLALREDRDPVTAHAVLADMRADGADRFAFIAEAMQAWEGQACLLEHDDERALRLLHGAVASMQRGDRLLELCNAAVGLSEAHWRAGDPDAADRAADVALAAAEAQGSHHLLLLALAEYPAVLSRRLDTEVDPESVWSEVARAMRASSAAASTTGHPARVHARELGVRELLWDGSRTGLATAKAHELVSWMAARGRTSASRGELLEALFDGRQDKAARNYLRQALHRLRQALPPEALDVSETDVAFAVGVRVSSDSVEAEARLIEALRLRGDLRRRAITDALRLVDRGPFMPGVRAAWADRRDRHLSQLVGEACEDAAGLALQVSDLEEAEALARRALDQDPYRDRCWRYLMQVAQLRGDEAGIVAVYEDCRRQFAELGTEPSRATRDLATALRR